jgi:hypothetical protein
MPSDTSVRWRFPSHRIALGAHLPIDGQDHQLSNSCGGVWRQAELGLDEQETRIKLEVLSLSSPSSISPSPLSCLLIKQPNVKNTLCPTTIQKNIKRTSMAPETGSRGVGMPAPFKRPERVDLDDGIILRWSTQDDTENIADCMAEAFRVITGSILSWRSECF